MESFILRESAVIDSKQTRSRRTAYFIIDGDSIGLGISKCLTRGRERYYGMKLNAPPSDNFTRKQGRIYAGNRAIAALDPSRINGKHIQIYSEEGYPQDEWIKADPNLMAKVPKEEVFPADPAKLSKAGIVRCLLIYLLANWQWRWAAPLFNVVLSADHETVIGKFHTLHKANRFINERLSKRDPEWDDDKYVIMVPNKKGAQ